MIFSDFIKEAGLMRGRKRRGETSSPREILPEILRKIERKAGGPLPLVAAKWDEAVGEEVGRHTEPVYFRSGKLTVEVDDGVWLAELARFHRGRMIKAVNESMGREVIKEISFRPKR